MFGHKIPLRETHPYESPPPLDGPFTAYCDECGKEYSYEPRDVLRFEFELHALFELAPAVQVEPQGAEQSVRARPASR
jgi:hypothetical protein